MAGVFAGDSAEGDKLLRKEAEKNSGIARYQLGVFGDYDPSTKSSGSTSPKTERIFFPVKSKFSFVDMGGVFLDDRGNVMPAMAHPV